MSGKLASSIVAGALLKRAEAKGGFGMVLAKGDPASGTIILVILDHEGGDALVLERLLDLNGGYSWRSSGSAKGIKRDKVPSFVAGRLRFDADSWILELDVPFAQRFAAEITASG